MASSLPQEVRARIFQQRVTIDNNDVDTLAMQQALIAATAAAARTQAAAAMAKANVAASTATSTADQVTTLQALAANVQSLSNDSIADRAALHATDADLQKQITALAAKVDALTSRTLNGQVAQATMTAVLVNGAGSLSFTWPAAWADTAYVPLLISPGIPVNTVAYTKTTTTCAVSFKATAVALGTVLNLVGYRVG